MITQRTQKPKRYTRPTWTSALEVNLLTIAGEAITIPPGATTLLRISAFLQVVVSGAESGNGTFGYSTTFDVTAFRGTTVVTLSGASVGTGTDTPNVGDQLNVARVELPGPAGMFVRVRANDDDGQYTGVLLSFEDDGIGGGTRTKTGYAIVERILETLGSA